MVAHDIKSGETRPILGMGRHNHENTVAVPGYDELVLLSGDDTFTNSPSQSQLYSYIAADTDAVWNDEGSLWAFVSDNTAVDEYEDFLPGSAASVAGHFIEVPRLIATGRKADGTEVMSSDVGFPPPPNDGTWQRDPNGIGIDGPQWVLDYWSKTNGVFRFVRVEDIAYDKRPGMDNVVYIADSGRGTAGASQARRSTNGRIWKMVLDPNDPRVVTSLSIFVEGDDNPVKTLGEVHQPDNVETTPNSLLITEDPGSSQQFTQAEAGLPNATTARLWRVPLLGGAPEVVAKVDQSADEGPTDVDSTTAKGQPRRLGVERRRRRICGLRAGRVPRDRPGGDPLGREGAGRRQRRAARAGLHVQALGRTARARPRARRIALRPVGQASGPDPPSSRVTKPGPPANRQWSTFHARPPEYTSASVT